MKRWRLWLRLTIILVLLLASPSRNTANLLENLSKLLPLAIDNQSIGLLFSQGLEKQYGLANDPQGSTRIQKIGQMLLSKIETKQKYDFAILQSSDFNACSIYGGHIRVFKGLLTDTQNSDNELAAVLAHELAHNELGHNKEAVKQFKVAYALDLAKISDKMPTLLLAGANAVLAKRSRQHEKAADQQALEWMAEAGFNPKGAIAVYRRIEAEHNLEKKRSGGDALQQRFSQIFATHPEPASRCDMAEDYLFTQKYGRTFKEVLGASTGRLANSSTTIPFINDSPIIVAHPFLWETPLIIMSKVTGVGVFNPATARTNRQQDVDFYLDILHQNRLACITGDNDFHAMPTTNLNLDFTFIDTADLSKEGLISAIKAGQTYASVAGIKIANENFRISSDYPKIQKVSWRFTLELPPTVALAPKIKVFRNNQEIGELEKINSPLERQPVYQLKDEKLAPGFYWYVLYIPSGLLTSPITCEVTGNSADPIDFPGVSSWHKGIIHCHSTHSSDGKSTLEDIWASKNQDVEFIFMTDHAEVFKEGGKSYSDYIEKCKKISPLLIPGVEYSLSGGKNRHLLVLGLDKIISPGMSEETFFDQETPEKLLILQGPVHLGDDVVNSQIEEDAVFDYGPNDATVKLRVKGTPFKDPILWINRQEIGRVVTTDNQWHWFEFTVPKGLLRNGQNLFHIESYIPDRWKTFDDCEIADVYILKK